MTRRQLTVAMFVGAMWAFIGPSLPQHQNGGVAFAACVPYDGGNLCASRNGGACEVAPGAMDIISTIIPYDHSTPGAYVAGPGAYTVSTNDIWGNGGGYCEPTAAGTPLGGLYFQVGYYRYSAGPPLSYWTPTSFPARHYNMECHVQYDIIGGNHEGVHCLTAWIAAQDRNWNPLYNIQLGTACSTLPFGTINGVITGTFNFNDGTLLRTGDNMNFYVTWAEGTPGFQALYWPNLKRWCTLTPHD